MIEPIFEGVSVRCKVHPHVLLKLHEIECDTCKQVRYNLSFTPPFSVMANKTYSGIEKNSIYKVVWVVKEGVKENNIALKGYVFKDGDGKICEKVYDPLDFTPIVEPEKPKEEREDEVDLYCY